MSDKQVTIKDIAKALNISPSTVSRALKDHPDISYETKKLVNDLAEELDYVPNPIALSLKGQKTKTVGVIIPEIVHFFFSTVISGIEEVAYKAGYNVMFCQSNESYEREVSDTKALISQRVDGILVSVSRETTRFDHFDEAEKKKIPVVFFDRKLGKRKASQVIVDDYEGARKATQHLIDQGYKRIAHLSGPDTLDNCKLRQEGYLDALKANQLSVVPEYIEMRIGEHRAEGYRSARQLLSLPEPPDAIFAHNDMVALGAMQAIKEAGLRVPQDIAIIGFSNWQFSELVEPQLSTIAQPGRDMGRAAAQLLINAIESDEEKIGIKTEVLPTELVIRSSTVK